MKSENDFSPSVEMTICPTDLAIELGDIHLAIIVQFLIHVIKAHKRLGRNCYDGKTWNYCTYAELCAYIPLLSEHQIKRKLHKLRKLGILQVGNYNMSTWDKTNWYAFVDEEKWGISKISKVGRNRPIEEKEPENSNNSYDGRNRSIDRTTSSALLYDHNLIKDTHIQRVNDHEAESLTLPKKRSLIGKKKKPSLDEEQLKTLEWLRGLELNVDDDTRSWWAKKYTRLRLEDVYQATLRAKPKSIGAMMQDILKNGKAVTTSQDAKNAEYAQITKSVKQWDNLEIHERYATIDIGYGKEEIPFNMDHEQFKMYLDAKYDTFEGAAMNNRKAKRRSDE